MVTGIGVAVQQNLSGFVVAYLMAGLTLFGGPTPVVMSSIDLNSLAQILSDLNAGGDPHSRSISKILVFELVSFALFAQDIYMYCKYQFIFILIPCQMAVAITSSLEMFIRRDANGVVSEDILLHHFESIRLAIIITKDFIGQQALHTIIFSQVLLTIAAWLSINCYRMLHIYFVATMLAAFVGCLVTAIFLLTIMANARNISDKIIQKKRAQFSNRSLGKSSQGKYFSLKWAAQEPLPLYCGTHFAIDKDAVMNFVNVLMDNITNVILLIIP